MVLADEQSERFHIPPGELIFVGRIVLYGHYFLIHYGILQKTKHTFINFHLPLICVGKSFDMLLQRIKILFFLAAEDRSYLIAGGGIGLAELRLTPFFH